MRQALTVALLLLAGAVVGVADPNTTTQQKLARVQKIYVGEMGTDPEAERFRLLLEEQLLSKGIAVVSKPEEADAVLSGALSVRVFDRKTEARVFVKLDTPRGERLWARDFGNRLFKNPFNRKEPTKLRAEDVANGLRNDLRKAAGRS